ncbi:MAG: Ig-like domain-containing protein [Lachnospiraceae bacterium]|nr:Ig-like domain-containing protein [Lachnospiraceae bacterium]
MRRKKLFGRQILSFLLAFVLLFSQSSLFAFAEGDDECLDEPVNEVDEDENPDERTSEEEPVGTTTEEDRVVVPYDKSLLNQVGAQGAYQCMAYAFAYATTIIDKKVHSGSEYWKLIDGVWQASWPKGWSDCTDRSLKTAYDNINLNKPMVLHVSGKYRAGHEANGQYGHWVTVIGYKKTANRDALKTSDFYIIDPGDYSYAYLSDNCSDGQMRVSVTTGNNGGGGSTGSYTVANSGVTNISKTGATINATVSPMAYVSEVGFYLGTSKTNMQKHVENTTGNVKSIWYDLGTGKWTGALSAGTTYYYRIYIVSGGKTYESSIDSFMTQPNPVTPSTDIKDGGRYLIESVLSGKVIEVSNGVDTDRKQLNVWEYTNDPWQSWIAVKSGDKYILKNAYTGKAMDVYKASLDEGAAITQFTLDGSASQYWFLDKKADGSYGIVNNNSGLAVDLMGFNKENGATLGQYIYYGNNNQLWYFNELNNDDDVIYDSGYTDVTQTTARINATLPVVRSCSDVGFYLGTSPDKMEKHNETIGGRIKTIWYDLGTGKWTSALSKGTTYYYQLYCVIDGITYKTPVNNFTTLGDKIAPNIKQAYITNITQDGYSVVCEATDNIGVTKVCFPTWTEANGQDDLVSDWPNNTKATSSKGNVYYYDVKISSHNNERGTYITHVYAFDADGNKACVQLSVVVPTYVSGITLSKTSLSLKAGEAAMLTATVAPSNATLKNLEWMSDDESIATVEDGKITAIAVGKTKVHVSAQDSSGVSATCEVTVTGSSNPTPGPEDDEKAVIAVSKVSGTAGSKVEVPVSISNNPGIASAGFKIDYDKTALTLSDIKAGKVFSEGTFDGKTSTGVVQWYYAGDDEVIKTNGELFRAVFTVNSSAAKGSYDVSVGLLNGDNANFTDQNGNAVPVSFTDGKVSVGMGVKGDLTGDGSVAMGDVVKVARAVAGYITLTAEEEALADVTGDGKVAMGDVVKIARFVAGYIDSLSATAEFLSSDDEELVITAAMQEDAEMIDMAEGEAAMKVAEQKAKPGDTVELPVEIETNPGIASAALSVSYDAASLELRSVTKGSVFENGTFTADVDKNLVQWYDVSTNKDTTATGTMFTLEFAVRSTATAGKHTVSVGYLDNDEANVTNIESKNVKVAFTDGVVEVEGGSEKEDPVPVGTAEIETGKASVNPGKTVEIPVQIKTNPGIAGLSLSVSYNNAVLTLKSITKGKVFTAGTFTGDPEKNLIQWYDVSSDKNTTATGVLFTLGFEAKSDAEAGKYAVSVGLLNGAPSNATNIDSENVPVTFTDGEVEITSGTITPPEPMIEKEDPFCIAPVITDKTTEIYLVKGQKFTMPDTGWTSSNKKQVTVSKKGVLTAKNVTAAPVTLTKGDRSIKVYVTKPVIDKSLTISDGEEHPIKLTYDTEHLEVYWYSSDPNVAKVDEDGIVEPISAGTATVTAYINSKAYKCKVKVVETELFGYRSIYLTEGAKKPLKIKGLKKAVWESDDNTVATVVNNKIVAGKPGYAFLSSTYEGKTYHIHVYVEAIDLDMRDIVQKGKNKYTITMVAGDDTSVDFKYLKHDYVFTSNKSEIAYVDKTGYLVARKAGKAKLTAKVNGKTVTITVTVK